MKDTLLGEILAVAVSVTGMIIALVRVNRNSIRRSIEIAEKTAEHRTQVDLKIIELNKDIIQMKDERVKYQAKIAVTLENIEARSEKRMDAFEQNNKDSHSSLFRLNEKQTGIISTMAAGIARIEGKMEGIKL